MPANVPSFAGTTASLSMWRFPGDLLRWFNRSGDVLTIGLHRPANTPASVLLRWPPSPTVCSSHPKALASIASARSAAHELELQVLATAQATLVQIRAEQL